MRGSFIALLSLWGTLVSADVFLRQPYENPQNWQRAYKAPYRLQNSKGELELFRSSDSLPLIEVALRNDYGDELAWIAGELMAWGMIIENGWLIRYLVQPHPEGGSWIVKYRQPLNSADKPGDTPDKHRLRDLPVYPQSTPTFYSHDEGNKVTVEISECSATPDAALQTLAKMTEEDGWAPSPLNTGGFQVFVKGEKVAFLGAQRGKDGRTRILRLHKPLGVK